MRKGSARLLARCFPEHCRDLDASLENFDVRYELCFSQDDETAVSLYRWYLNRGCNPDPAFGLLLTPEWIARQATEFPDTIARLARQTGYIETEAIADALPLLEDGCWCIPADVSASDRIHLSLRSAEIERAVHQLLTVTRRRSPLQETLRPHSNSRRSAQRHAALTMNFCDDGATRTCSSSGV